MSATAGFFGNVGTQLATSDPCANKEIDWESAGWSALAGGLGGAFGASTAGLTNAQGLPIFTQFGNQVVGSTVGGISAGGYDVIVH